MSPRSLRSPTTIPGRWASAALGVALALAARPASAADPAEESPLAGKGDASSSGATTIQPGRFLRVTWDANLEGALGGMFGPTRLIGFTRGRAGILIVDEQNKKLPRFYSLGATYEASNFRHVSTALGLQAELFLPKSYFWAQLGVSTDFQPRPGFNASAGISIFGVEGQMRWDRDRTEGELTWGVFGKIRVPVSWFFAGRSR
ncbi:MAG: hypothetical protein U0359_14990 [Byssovorax sp.]